MIKSMTAYGRGQAAAGDGQWIVEFRTVNSRFLDVHLRAPSGILPLEDRIKKTIGARISRGRVNINITASGAVEATPRLVLNKPLFEQFKTVVQQIETELELDRPVGAWPYLNYRDMILSEEETPDLNKLWSQLEPALNLALDEAEQMRTTEGESLKQDFLMRLERLDGLFKEVAARSPEIVENYRQRLNERVEKLVGDDVVPDAERLATEVAIIADKCDITEEAVRAQSHLEQFHTFLEETEPVGRKLDFLLQELNREANTMGSKSPDASAGTVVVDIKAELERLREQVQNIE